MADYFGDIHIKLKRQTSKKEHISFLSQNLIKFDLFSSHEGLEIFTERDSIWSTFVIVIEKNKKLFFTTGLENSNVVSWSSASKNTNEFFLQNDNLNKMANWFSDNYPDELLTVTTWDAPYSSEEIVEVAHKRLSNKYDEFSISRIYSNGLLIE